MTHNDTPGTVGVRTVGELREHLHATAIKTVQYRAGRDVTSDLAREHLAAWQRGEDGNEGQDDEADPIEYAQDQHRCLPGLDAPERFAGGEVVAAVRLPVDVSLYPRRHAVVVKHTKGGWQTFSTHEIAHNRREWVGAQGHYDLTWHAALADMIKRSS